MALSVHIKKKLKDFELAVDFDMDEGIVGFLGSSGCGKSMTLKCIAGIETPDEGRIVLDDEVLFDKKSGINLSPQKRKVGLPFSELCIISTYECSGKCDLWSEVPWHPKKRSQRNGYGISENRRYGRICRGIDRGNFRRTAAESSTGQISDHKTEGASSG